MELEIKCLECGKRTRRFEIGSAFIMDECEEILLGDNIICPKCKKDISNEKCITSRGRFMISLMAHTISMLGEKEGDFKIPPHLKGLTIVAKEDYDALKKQSRASIKLANRL